MVHLLFIYSVTFYDIQFDKFVLKHIDRNIMLLKIVYIVCSSYMLSWLFSEKMIVSHTILLECYQTTKMWSICAKTGCAFFSQAIYKYSCLKLSDRGMPMLDFFFALLCKMFLFCFTSHHTFDSVTVLNNMPK